MSVKFNNSYKKASGRKISVMILTFILFLFHFFILCKSTLQCRKISHSETFEKKFQCENFNEIFTPRKFHEICHHYCVYEKTSPCNVNRISNDFHLDCRRRSQLARGRPGAGGLYPQESFNSF